MGAAVMHARALTTTSEGVASCRNDRRHIMLLSAPRLRPSEASIPRSPLKRRGRSAADPRTPGSIAAVATVGGLAAGALLEYFLDPKAGRTIEDGTKAAMQMINESSDATAVQTVSDLVAVGCAEALMSQGLRIPEDISIVGFGNLLLATYYRIPLTTVRQPKFRLGSAAMDSMVQLMRGQKVEPKRLSAELIVRSSSGIPSATHRLGQLKTTSKETTTTL